MHCHILPGIDDGPAEFDEAVAMCRMAAEDGCTAMVATPHLRHHRWWNGDRLQLEWLLERLSSELSGVLELHLGGEIALHSESFDEMLDSLPGGQLLSLAGSRYLLLELDWQGFGPDPREVVFELKIRGLVPVIAHPERVSWLMEDPELLTALVEDGALVQITAGSLTGFLGKEAQQASQRLLDDGQVHFIASDAHGVRRRPPGLTRARKVVEEGWGEEVAKDLFERHPQAILENRASIASPSLRVVRS